MDDMVEAQFGEILDTVNKAIDESRATIKEMRRHLRLTMRANERMRRRAAKIIAVMGFAIAVQSIAIVALLVSRK